MFCIVFIIKSNSIRELTYICIVYILASEHPFLLKLSFSSQGNCHFETVYRSQLAQHYTELAAVNIVLLHSAVACGDISRYD